MVIENIRLFLNTKDEKQNGEFMKANQFTHFFLRAFTVTALFIMASFSYGASKVIDNVDYIYLHIGLQVDYPLPESFKDEKLKFEGNYSRYTTAIYRRNKNDIRFKPKRQGSSIMIIKNKEDKIITRLHIDIQRDNLHKIAAELRDLFIAIDGIEVKIYNKKVIIDGQVLLPREMDRINAVVAKYGDTGLVHSLVTYSPQAQKKIAEIIEKEIGYPEVTVRYAYNRFLLEGCVNSPDEKTRALHIAELYTQFEVSSVGEGASRKGVAVVRDDIIVPCESEKKADKEEKKKKEVKKLIQIVVHFVEMEKNFSKGFLFEWAPAIGDNGTQVTASTGNVPGAQTGITAVLTATVQNFFPKLQWAKTFNFARVLHNSSLLVEEGQSGTINIQTQTVQHDGRTIFGSAVSAQVSTQVRPTIIGERNNLIHMNVVVNVSSSPSKSSTTTRSINTFIHVRDGASAVLGGLISSILNREYNNEPAPSALLNLHSAKNYTTTKSQFVVFITPLIKSSSSLGVERIKRKFKLDE